jgi:hypothetical protein
VGGVVVHVEQTERAGHADAVTDHTDKQCYR